MPVIDALIRTEEDGTISFGNYTLNTKSKLQDFEHAGDLYKVKTFYEITKLERNGLFVYESVPGTAVTNFNAAGDDISFTVEGYRSSQISVQLAEDAEYEVFLDGESAGTMGTNMSGKLAICAELTGGKPVEVKFVRK